MRSPGEQAGKGRVLPAWYADGRWPYDDLDPLCTGASKHRKDVNEHPRS
ncbi:hypothetical protein [Streptomyces sp. NPDC050504]